MTLSLTAALVGWFLLSTLSVSAWTTRSPTYSRTVFALSVQQQQHQQHDNDEDNSNDVPRHATRRAVLLKTFAVALGTSQLPLVSPTAAAAAAVSSVPSIADLERIRKGHARIAYLLEHWDDVTQVCGTTIRSDTERKQVVRTEGGGGTTGCEKTPLNVQQYMGYKSTEDPLYRVDKLLVKAVSLVEDEPEAYLEAVEKYKEKADYVALMAYTSSWGEANPNGGKEVIDEYLSRTKLDVIDSERYLRQILGYLKLDPLPPRKNP